MLKKTLLLVCLFSLVVFSQQWQERLSWWWNGESWVSQFGNPTARARKWLEYNPIADSCNKERWEIPFLDTISVAQWIRWSIEGTKNLWRVRKIGTFAGIGPIICLKSNEDVAMSFQGFENPTNGETEIEKWYGFTDTTVEHPSEVSQWISATDLNNYTIRFEFPNGCQPQSIKIWEKIEVEQCDRACEYIDPEGATIILTLTVIKPWIDKRTGLFKSLPIEPPYIIDIEN
ncbi:MAG: hypothetical protein ABIK78_03495 [candidate division WOR-3 bacterium]